MNAWSNLQDKRTEYDKYIGRLWLAVGLIIVIFLMLLLQLSWLQIFEHERYVTASEDNRQQLQPLVPTRGLIYDHNGVLLANNKAIYNLTLVPEQVPGSKSNLQQVLDHIEQLIGLNESDRQRFWQRLDQYRRPYSAIPLRFQLNEQEVAVIAVNQHLIPGVKVVADLVRHYPIDGSMVHALGYVGRINERDLARLDADNYGPTNYIGKLGVEKFYEQELHGKVGFQTVETNARGRVLRVLQRHDPVPGATLVLHLDAQLQQLSNTLLRGRRGAIVAIDPRSGGILVLVSSPSYRANQFVTGISNKRYAALRDSLDLPLFNRALQGRYPPASTVKPMIALAAINSGRVGRGYTIWDPGYYQLTEGGRLYRDWKDGGHGWVNLHKSIVESVDTYYYDLAHRMGNKIITDMLGDFGLGQVTIADQPDAIAAVLPTRDWKRAWRNDSWYPGDSLNLGIGQGFLSATPLQLATATMVLANKGRWVQPRMLKRINDQLLTNITDLGRETVPVPNDVKLKNAADWDRIQTAMIDVMHGQLGTGRSSGIGSIYKMAGKTGTAQVLGIKQDATYDANEIAERFRDHSLFVGWAPANDPRIVLAIVVENGGGGGATATPLARQIFDYYLLNSDGQLKNF